MPSYLLATPEHWERARRRVAAGHWTAGALEGLRHRVKPFVDEQFHWPEEAGGWAEWFVCDACGAQLVVNLRRPRTHACSACGATYRDDPKRDAAWSCRYLTAWSAAGRDVAALGALTGDAAAVSRAVTVFNTLADTYARLPARPRYENDVPRAAPGRAMADAADEARFWWNLLWLWDTLEAGDGAHELNVAGATEAARAALEVMAAEGLGVHRRQMWQMSCLLGLAMRLQAGARLTTAMESLASNIAYGFLEDGCWFERALSAGQTSVLQALTPALLAAKLQGAYSPGLDVVHTACRFLLDLAWRDGTLPATNDGPAGGRIGDCAELFYLAPLLWKDGEELLREFVHLERGVTPLVALLHAGDATPLPSFTPRRTVHYATSGFSVMRTGTVEAVVKFGAHGGPAYGHPDKLALNLRAPGVEACDLGALPDPHPLTAGWYRATLSHNTVRIAEANQEPAEAELIADGALGRCRWAAWMCRELAPGAFTTRAVWLHPRGLLDVVGVVTRDPAVVEYVFRATGDITADTSPDTHAWPTAGETHAGLAGLRRVAPAAPHVTWPAPEGGGLRAYVLAPGAADTWIAAAPGNPPAHRQGVLLVRAPDTAFAAFAVAYTWGDWLPPPEHRLSERVLTCAWPEAGLRAWRFDWRAGTHWLARPAGLAEA